MQNFVISFSHPFDETLDIDIEQASASKVIEVFKNIAWKDFFIAYHETKNDDAFDYFEVEFEDADNISFNIDISLYKDFDEEIKINPENVELKFDVSFYTSKTVLKKVLFGLFGERNELKQKSFYLENQKLEMTFKCLYAFVSLDFDFLKQNMEEL
ncbi:MAG: hypothetical protein U0U67_12770 [Chitinophagales bacterium]